MKQVMKTPRLDFILIMYYLNFYSNFHTSSISKTLSTLHYVFIRALSQRYSGAFYRI